ncbi:hypothetical protein [Bacteroides sp. 51]|uniref:CIS tube protein n=1 Tax=Bacteroides sp. 51 TaxID=2302938 RepID=UPI0013D35040|nr:hypothetical protein [Bacteroides sp. 51]NDV82961.1 hypothetical protein [Bacteroides sp. 51]
MGALEKLTIIGYEDGECTIPTNKKFTAMINPTTYGRKQSVSYHNVEDMNGVNAPTYQGYNDGTLNLKFVLDTTGVVPRTGGKNLQGMIKQLEATVYKYVGKAHETPYVKVTWGVLDFRGRVKDLEVEYKLFSPAGMPLRAEVTLNIIAYKTPKTQKREENSNSPDLSHIITVKAGDTLPWLCKEVYNSAAYCMEVARINGLTGIRDIAPGTRLLFPPLANA